MAFGWLCALAQGDAPPEQPRIAGILMIFASALASLSLPAIRSLRARRAPQILMALVVGFQILVCLYVVAIEFTL
jgi:hypothetical protein